MPGRPVTLIGHTGGGAMAAFMLEALPAGVQVDRACFLAPALSPGYNLAAALRGVRDTAYATHSWIDFGLMGLGTLALGTMDRRHRPSAGLVGFRLPQGISGGRPPPVRQVAADRVAAGPHPRREPRRPYRLDQHPVLAAGPGADRPRAADPGVRLV